MEKIPAASAMDWSIELDKGLRSKNLQRQIQALETIGPRLHQLGISSSISMAVADMYDLMPGEDRLFANTILLRLTDAFKDGDNFIRARIVKAFLLEFRELSKKGRRYNGILAKARVLNHEEMLKRVIAVYDAGDARARALALRMLGCMANLAKDSPQACYMVLSSLNSANIVEVKAALFTVGCFCLLSEDFSSIILEVLRNFICSSRVDPEVIPAAIRAFSKLQCTLDVTHRAYKVGKRLLLDTLADGFKADMLFSLSKLAFKSIILIAEQVDLLLFFIRHESSVLMKTRALKCLHILFRRNSCHFPVSRDIFTTLLQIIEDTNLPLCCQSDAFGVLRKVFCTKASNVLSMNSADLSKLILTVEGAAHSSAREIQDVALHLIVDIFFSLRGARREMASTTSEKLSSTCIEFQVITNNMLSTSGEDDLELLANKITALILDHIISLVTQVMSEHKELARTHANECRANLKTYCKSLFGLILKVAKDCPSAGFVALDRVKCLMQNLRCINESLCEAAGTYVKSSQTELAHERPDTNKSIIEQPTTSIKASPMEVDFDKPNSASAPRESNNKKKTSTLSELILFTFRFSIACLNVLYKSGAASCDVYPVVKVLIECVQQHACRYCGTYEFFCLFMHSNIAWSSHQIARSKQELGNSEVQHALFFTPSFWLVQELRALGITKMLVRERNYWEAYRSGMYCSQEGLWFTASFVFKKLAEAFESSSFSFWFRSLLLLAGSEIEMKLLLFPMATIKLIDELQTEGNYDKLLSCAEIDADSTLIGCSDLHSYEGKLAGICSRICSSVNTLESNGSSDNLYFFQRWFISLRSKFLEILNDILGILGAHSFAQKDIDRRQGNGQSRLAAVSEHIETQALGLANCALRLSHLAKDYDLLATSYMDMDNQSFMTMARLAFMCSILAFCTAYSLDFSLLPGCENVMPFRLGNKFSHASILQDLLERSLIIDSQIACKLQQLMTGSSEEMEYLHSRTRINCSGHMERDSYFLCQFALSALLCLRRDAKEVTDEDHVLPFFDRGMQYLSNILQKWIELPFQVPKYFFRTRPCPGAELFMFDSNAANRQGILISPGYQLPLNLCIQLKNVLERTSIQIAQLYCILAASPSSCIDVAEIKGKTFSHLQVNKTSEIVELNAMLLQYIKNDARKACHINVDHDVADVVTTCVIFELNERGQGFSDCLLNVSAFPEGSYQIKWHACCVDDNGSYWSLLPLNAGVVFCIRKS